MTEPHPARIFLVDDHPIVRDGFRMRLDGEEDITVVGEAGSGEEALEKLRETEVDLAVVDVSMDGMDGIELTRRLNGGDQSTVEKEGQEGPKEGEPSGDGPLVLIVSMHAETYYVESALEAGARGYVVKENAPSILIEAVRAVLNGETYLCPITRGKL